VSTRFERTARQLTQQGLALQSYPDKGSERRILDEALC